MTPKRIPTPELSEELSAELLEYAVTLSEQLVRPYERSTMTERAVRDALSSWDLTGAITVFEVIPTRSAFTVLTRLRFEQRSWWVNNSPRLLHVPYFCVGASFDIRAATIGDGWMPVLEAVATPAIPKQPAAWRQSMSNAEYANFMRQRRG